MDGMEEVPSPLVITPVVSPFPSSSPLKAMAPSSL